jgi:protein-disulfide isomerase
MGGAARNDKRRRQEEANRRLAAAGIQVPARKSTNRTPLIIVAVVVTVAVVAGAAVLYFRSSGTASAAPTYTTTVSGAVVTAGTGKVVVDTYEDYLCPNCERFEQRDGAAITAALNAGQISVRYHQIAILDSRTTPPGYSTRAANAAICAASAGIFPAYHKKLYASQPAEGSAGLTDAELVAFGTELGAAGDFAGCVTGATHAAAVTAETEKAAANISLQTNGQFGTPTIAVNGTRIDLNDSDWLKNAIAGA